MSSAYSLAPPADLNGDGYLDIAVLTHPTPPATGIVAAILINKGNAAPGTLSSATTYTVPTVPPGEPSSITTGDFNGDGKQDLAVGYSPVGIFYGNGDGTFQPAQTVQITGSFVAGDFNQDGITDLAYLVPNDPTNPGNPGSTLQVLLSGNSSKQFTTGPSLAGLTAPATGSSILTGAFGSGNILDLAVIGNSTQILLGDGNGGFTAGQSYAVSGKAVIEAGSNGKTNLVFYLLDGLTLLSGNGDGTFQGVPTLPLNTPVNPVAADFNGDGLTDVLSVNYSTSGASNNLVTALGRGNGTFSVTSQVAGPTPGIVSVIVTGDFNADGKLDAAVVLPGNGVGHGFTTQQDAQLFFYAGNGDGSFQLFSQVPRRSICSPSER